MRRVSARRARSRPGRSRAWSLVGADRGAQSPRAPPRSSLRELMPSLVNTLRRWYSTVRGLMNSWAPISGFVCPSRGEPGDLRLLRGELVARLGACACGRSRRWPAARAGRARRTPRRRSRRTSRRRRAAARGRRRAGSRGAATRRTQMGAGELDAMPGAREPLDRLAVERVGRLASLSSARERASDAERPVGAAARGRSSSRASAVGRDVGPPLADGRLDQLDERPADEAQVVVLAAALAARRARPRSGRAVVQHRRRVARPCRAPVPRPARGASPAPASISSQRLAPRAAPGGEQQPARTPAARAGRLRDRVGLLDQRRGGGELAGVDVRRRRGR